MKKILLTLCVIGASCWSFSQQITSFTYRTTTGPANCINCVDSVGPGVYTQSVSAYSTLSTAYEALSVQFAGNPNIKLFIEHNSNQLPTSNCIELINGGLGWSGWLETNGCGSHGPNIGVRFRLEGTAAILEARMCSNDAGSPCTPGATPVVGTQTVLPGGAWGNLLLFDGHHNNAIQFRIVSPGSPAAPNDAGVASIDTPMTFCSGPQNIWTTVQNYGINQIDTVSVDWSFNGVLQTSVLLTQVLDTLNGSGPNSRQVYLGTRTMTTVDTIKVWTSMPNNVADTVNLNDTMTYIGGPALNGTYTLGGVTANYPTFQSAVSDLIALGVCGPVTFLGNPGTYTEQISIPQITGASNFNTITFVGVSNQTATLTFGPTLSTAPYTLRFDGGDFIKFDSLIIENTAITYRHVIEYQGGSDANSIQNCTITQSQLSNSTSTNYALVWCQNTVNNNNSFIDNTFDGGSYGMYWYGAGTTSLSDGTVIHGNTFQGQYFYGLRSYYQDNIKIEDNTMYYTNTYTGAPYAIYMQYCDNETRVTGNLIVGDTANQGVRRWYMGLYMANCDGTALNHQLIANNMISNPDTVYTGTIYGMYFTNNGFQDIIHNSVCIANNSVNSYAVYTNGGGGNTFENNIVSNMGTGYAMRINSGFSFTSVNYNNLYAPNGNVGFYTVAQATMANWQSAAGVDLNSFNVNPLFYSKWDLHTCADTLESAGTPTTLTAVDIDKDTRGSIPDIGADEFATLNGTFLGADTAICPGDSIMIGVPGLNGSFAWSTGDSTNTIWVTNPATYILTATSLCGSGSDNIVITNLPLPVASFTQVVSFYAVTFTSTSTNATSYWWDFGDGNTSTLQNPVHVYAWPGGTFNVTHVAYNNCGNDTTVIVVTADESTGLVDNAFAQGVSVYPNPASGDFNVSLNLTQGQEATIEIMNVAGAAVQTKQVIGKQGTNVVNFNADIAAGAYFVRIQSDNNTAMKKLIIE